MTATARSSDTPALDIRNLTVMAEGPDGRDVCLLDDVSFSVMPTESVGLVGESGSGKSMTSLTVMGLLPSGVTATKGEIRVFGEDVLSMSPRRLRELRGSRMSMVLQDPMTSLNPSYTIFNQLAEAFRLNTDTPSQEVRNASRTMLEKVRIQSAEQRLDQYPHQLSGGMRQRVTSAIALAGSPELLIADEPTTALDVTTQAQYLALLRSLQEATGFALVLITHDLFVVRSMCDRVIVMYGGQVVEQGPLQEVLASPQHPYTRALFDTVPKSYKDHRLKTIEGQAPDPATEIPGCRFAPRCEYARELCTEKEPGLTPRGSDARSARCFGTAVTGWIEDL